MGASGSVACAGSIPPLASERNNSPYERIELPEFQFVSMNSRGDTAFESDSVFLIAETIAGTKG